MQKPDFNKIKTSVKTAAKECFNIMKNIDTKLLSVVVSIAMLLSSFGIITKYYTLGYDVYYGDVNIGVITDKDEAIKAYNEAQTDVANLNGDEFDQDLRFVMTIAPVGTMSAKDIYRGIVQAAEGEETCYSIETENGSVAKLKTQGEAEEALRLFRESFNRADAEVYTGYSIVQSTDIITSILTVEDAVKAIDESNLIKVVYRDETKVNVALPYEEIVVEDSSLSVGLTVVMQEGSIGKGVETSVVFYENGVAKHDIAPSVSVLEAPCDRVVHIGTGTMVGLKENSMPWPNAGTLTSEYGRRWGRNHNGIDIAAKTGTPIYAPSYGKVTFAGTRSGYGNYVVIDHGMGYETTYAHMDSISVCEGQVVNVGDKVGAVGTTGRVTGAHLHFEVLINGQFADPMTYIAG